MSLISFIQEAGEKLFNHPKAAPAAAPAAAPTPDIAALNATAGQAIEKYIAAQGLKADGLDVAYDGASHREARRSMGGSRRSGLQAWVVPRSGRKGGP